MVAEQIEFGEKQSQPRELSAEATSHLALVASYGPYRVSLQHEARDKAWQTKVDRADNEHSKWLERLNTREYAAWMQVVREHGSYGYGKMTHDERTAFLTDVMLSDDDRQSDWRNTEWTSRIKDLKEAPSHVADATGLGTIHQSRDLDADLYLVR